MKRVWEGLGLNSQLKEIFGSVLSTIGTIEAALGSTPQLPINQQLKIDLRLQGNILQATGEALSADGQGTYSLELIGDEVQAVGNSLVVTGILFDPNKDLNQRIIITGNWFQALGSFVALSDEFFDLTPSGRSLNIVGGFLQGIGNSMQAKGGIESLRDKSSESGEALGFYGSWIQAIGSVLSLIGQMKEELQEIALHINE